MADNDTTGAPSATSDDILRASVLALLLGIQQQAIQTYGPTNPISGIAQMRKTIEELVALTGSLTRQQDQQEAAAETTSPTTAAIEARAQEGAAAAYGEAVKRLDDVPAEERTIGHSTACLMAANDAYNGALKAGTNDAAIQYRGTRFEMIVFEGRITHDTVKGGISLTASKSPQTLKPDEADALADSLLKRVNQIEEQSIADGVLSENEYAARGMMLTPLPRVNRVYVNQWMVSHLVLGVGSRVVLTTMEARALVYALKREANATRESLRLAESGLL